MYGVFRCPNKQSLTNLIAAMSQKQILSNLLAENKIAQVITQLLSITKSDDDLNGEVTQISARFQQNENQRRLNLADSDEINREYAKIRNALLSIINRLPDSSGVLPVVKKQNWLAIGAFIVGLIAIVANIGTIKDSFFKKGEPKQVVQSSVEPQKNVGKPVVELPVEKSREPTIQIPQNTPSIGKNKVHIEVKDKAKVGAIITGDSNKIDLKQDF